MEWVSLENWYLQYRNSAPVTIPPGNYYPLETVPTWKPNHSNDLPLETSQPVHYFPWKLTLRKLFPPENLTPQIIYPWKLHTLFTACTLQYFPAETVPTWKLFTIKIIHPWKMYALETIPF